MTRCRTTLGVALLVFTVRGAVAAQTATNLLFTGMQLYQNLDYDAAAATLRKGLARATGDTFSTAERLQALSYLGATELFRSHRDSAVAAFRQIVVADPKYRPSDVFFPPQVTNLFQDVQRTTRTVFVQVPPVTEFRAGKEAFTARLTANAPHDIAVALTQEDGTPVRRIWAGPIVDSLALSWDGLVTEEGEPVKSGRYLLRIASRASGAPQLVRQVTLDIERAKADTLPWPSATVDPFRGARTSSGPAVRSLAGGVLAALAVVVLPSVVAQNATGIKGRFAVAAALGGAGIAGYVAQRPGRPLDASAAASAVARDARKGRIDQVRAENAKRRSEVRLRVTASRTTVLEQATP